MEELGKTNVHFVECLLPRKQRVDTAAILQSCIDGGVSQRVSKSFVPVTASDGLTPIDVPLLRSQLRSAGLLPSVILNKLGKRVNYV